jgi:hypothetical protein
MWPLEKPTAALLLHTNRPSAVSVKFHNYNNSDRRVAGRLRVPTVHSRDILLQAKGGSSWLSPLRSVGSRDEQAGEAGLAEP